MKKVLFVCTGNAARSQMAEAFAKQLGRGKIDASSAGVLPSKDISQTAAKVMLEKGIDISKNKPKKLTAEMSAGVDLVVTMGCSVQDICPAPLLRNVVDWQLEDTKGMPIEKVREVRDEIERRVVKLLKTLLSEN